MCGSYVHRQGDVPRGEMARALLGENSRERKPLKNTALQAQKQEERERTSIQSVT